MRSVLAIFKREFAAYFATPLAYVFIVIFLFAMGAFTFYIGRFSKPALRASRYSSATTFGFICFWFLPSACGYGPKSENPERSSCC
ncbi:MAG: hypothetical protein V3S07_00160 [Micropepsaceae bacterium]